VKLREPVCEVDVGYVLLPASSEGREFEAEDIGVEAVSRDEGSQEIARFKF
jgi:hypothetical protein